MSVYRCPRCGAEGTVPGGTFAVVTVDGQFVDVFCRRCVDAVLEGLAAERKEGKS